MNKDKAWLTENQLRNMIKIYSHTRFTDTRLIRKPHYYGQFALSLGKESPYFFSKFNPLNTDTSSIWTLSMAPSMPVLTEFDCIKYDENDIKQAARIRSSSCHHWKNWTFYRDNKMSIICKFIDFLLRCKSSPLSLKQLIDKTDQD